MCVGRLWNLLRQTDCSPSWWYHRRQPCAIALPPVFHHAGPRTVCCWPGHHYDVFAIGLDNCRITWNNCLCFWLRWILKIHKIIVILIRTLKFCYFFFFLNLSCGKSIFNKGCLATKSWYIKYQDFIKFKTNSLSSLLIFFSIVFNILSYKGKRNWNQVSNISKKELEKFHYVYHYRIAFNAWLQFTSLCNFNQNEIFDYQDHDLYK